MGWVGWVEASRTVSLSLSLESCSFCCLAWDGREKKECSIIAESPSSSSSAAAAAGRNEKRRGDKQECALQKLGEGGRETKGLSSGGVPLRVSQAEARVAGDAGRGQEGMGGKRKKRKLSENPLFPLATGGKMGYGATRDGEVRGRSSSDKGKEV